MSWGLACTEMRLHTGCLCHISLPSCVILMTVRPCCIYSAAGNQSPTPGIAAAQISKQVQLCWLALSLLSACGCAVSPHEIQTWWVVMLLLPPESQRAFGSLYKTQTSSSKLASLLSFRDTSWGVQIPLSPHLYFLAGMVALVDGQGVSAHPHHYIRLTGEVCGCMTRQAQAQAQPAVQGTAASRPAQPDVLKVHLKCAKMLPHLWSHSLGEVTVCFYPVAAVKVWSYKTTSGSINSIKCPRTVYFSRWLSTPFLAKNCSSAH